MQASLSQFEPVKKALPATIDSTAAATAALPFTEFVWALDWNARLFRTSTSINSIGRNTISSGNRIWLARRKNSGFRISDMPFRGTRSNLRRATLILARPTSASTNAIAWASRC